MPDFSDQFDDTSEQTKFEKSCNRYGITLEKGYQLLISGEWHKFVSRESTKRSKARKKFRVISAKEFKCPKCERIIPDPEKWCNHGKWCIECSQQIGKRTREDAWKCTFCNELRYKDDAIQIGSQLICDKCKEKVERILRNG